MKYLFQAVQRARKKLAAQHGAAQPPLTNGYDASRAEMHTKPLDAAMAAVCGRCVDPSGTTLAFAPMRCAAGPHLATPRLHLGRTSPLDLGPGLTLGWLALSAILLGSLSLRAPRSCGLRGPAVPATCDARISASLYLVF